MTILERFANLVKMFPSINFYDTRICIIHPEEMAIFSQKDGYYISQTCNNYLPIAVCSNRQTLTDLLDYIKVIELVNI